MRIDDTNYDDYIDYIIYTIHELKANTKSQIEGFRFVTKQLKGEKVLPVGFVKAIKYRSPI